MRYAARRTTPTGPDAPRETRPGICHPRARPEAHGHGGDRRAREAAPCGRHHPLRLPSGVRRQPLPFGRGPAADSLGFRAHRTFRDGLIRTPGTPARGRRLPRPPRAYPERRGSLPRRSHHEPAGVPPKALCAGRGTGDLWTRGQATPDEGHRPPDRGRAPLQGRTGAIRGRRLGRSHPDGGLQGAYPCPASQTRFTWSASWRTSTTSTRPSTSTCSPHTAREYPTPVSYTHLRAHETVLDLV